MVFEQEVIITVVERRAATVALAIKAWAVAGKCSGEGAAVPEGTDLGTAFAALEPGALLVAKQAAILVRRTKWARTSSQISLQFADWRWLTSLVAFAIIATAVIIMPFTVTV